MQIHGVGNENIHSEHTHHITECIQRQDEHKKMGGASYLPSADKKKDGSVETGVKDNYPSMTWLRNLFSEGRKLWSRAWGNGERPNALSEETAETVVEEAAAGFGIQQQSVQNSPYFSAIEDTGRAKETLWEKVRVKFHSVTGQLTGRFSNRNSFQAKQGKPKEDLRKHSRYRQDDLEIECILTDDSYLLDSYDRKGEYSKLSAKK